VVETANALVFFAKPDRCPPDFASTLLNLSRILVAMPSSTRKPRTILFFDHTAQLGGGEIALLHLVQHLDKQLFTPLVVLGSEGPLRQRLLEAGVETHVLPLAESIVQTRKA